MNTSIKVHTHTLDGKVAYPMNSINNPNAMGIKASPKVAPSMNQVVAVGSLTAESIKKDENK